MSLLHVIEDAGDPRLADYVALREVSLRLKLETDGGLFIAEGEKVIRRAIETGYRPRSFLLAERWLPGLADVLDASPGVPVYAVTEALAEAVTGFHVHRGALASLHRGVPRQASSLLDAGRLVVIEDVVDHTNIGAMLRSAAGLGWDGVLLSPRSADPLYRRAVKTSMGAVFSLPWARLDDWAGAVSWLQAAGFEVAAMALRDDAVSLDDYAADVRGSDRRIALLMGTEGAGLSSRWISAADVVVQIPMTRGIDSLNVAAATAVACHALR